MKVDDRVYGEQTVDEELLESLVASAPVQRLKDVSQAGPQPFFMDKPRLTRYEHSLGVMLLLRAHGANTKEQVAGLLHDVPHTAFSHLADIMFETEQHEYHERFLDKIVHSSDVPEILEGHGISVDEVLDESQHRLLERDGPDLCADRIDYFLRDATAYRGLDPAPLRDGLTTHGGRFVVQDKPTAESFAMAYLDTDATCWANPAEWAVQRIFGNAVQAAMEAGALAEADLFRTDTDVLDAVTSCDDARVQDQLALLRNGFSVIEDPDEPDLHYDMKVRWVDPHVLQDGGDPVPVSELSERVSAAIERHRTELDRTIPLRIQPAE